jgi:hypothetical protein
MSSSHKRAAIMRAQAETERLRQQLILSQHHYNVIKATAEVLAARVDAAEANAARYLWLRDGNAFAPEEEGIRGGEELDALCDQGRTK